MLFNSLSFAIFLPIVFLIYWAAPKKARYVILLISSYYFYMSWNVRYVVLILFTTIVSYFCALLCEKEDSEKKKKLWVILAVISSLSVLFFFKYFNFTFESIQRLADLIKIPLHTPTLNLMLPVGISFYTFQTLSYVADVYNKKVSAEKNFFLYAAFISFFPQLVAGPIERTENLLPQIKSDHVFTYEEGSYGARLMAWGFFKKLVIADNMAAFADVIFEDPTSYTGSVLIFAILFFTIQIYCDFSGYSDIAIGTARLFDIKLMRNFESPYFAISMQDFWRRWHISLSTWFRDYVYIPLGGSRRGKIRSYVNLIITFTLSGLWHGAAFKYIAWGLFHGIAQCAEKIFKLNTRKNDEVKSPVKIAIRRVCVFLTAAALWCFFRANSLKQALYFFANMFKGALHPVNYVLTGLSFFDTRLLCFMILPLILLFIFDKRALKSDPLKDITGLKAGVRWIIYVLFFLLFMLLASFNSKEFVYFKF